MAEASRHGQAILGWSCLGMTKSISSVRRTWSRCSRISSRQNTIDLCGASVHSVIIFKNVVGKLSLIVLCLAFEITLTPWV